MTVSRTERFTTKVARHLLAALLLCWVAGLTGFEDDAKAASPAGEHSSIHESVTVDPELLLQLEKIAHVRIVLHAQEPQRQLVTQVSTLLTALGAERVEQRLVQRTPEDHKIRYFHPTDREAAASVHGALTLVFEDIDLRDFTHFRPSPHQELIEVWL